MTTLRVSLLVAILSWNATAQTVTATITGTVTDSSGAAVPGASVVAANKGTSVARTVFSGDNGDFTIPYLPPGVYTVSVEAQGFKRSTVDTLELVLDQRARLDFRLEIGQVRETVVVEASAALVQSESSSVGQVIGSDQIVSLPLKGRAFYELALLSPGVSPRTPNSFNARARSMPGGLTIPAFQVAGAREVSNGYFVDGVSAADPHFNLPSAFPPVDSIQEFKLQTSAFSAEFGRSAAQINAATRSGTNEYHGTLYHFFRNEKLDASNFFSNLTGQRRAPLRYNLFGATVGAPVRIPNVYDGKNRTFYFLSWESTRMRRGKTAQMNVPTLAQRAGDFSRLGFRNNRAIYDPATNRANPAGGFLRDPFAGNVIPASRFTPFGRGALGFYPAPIFDTATGNNFSENLSDPSDNNQGMFRIDQKINDRMNLFYRYSIFRGNETTLLPVREDGELNDVRTQNMAFSLLTTLTPSTLWELRMGYNRPVYLKLQSGSSGPDYATLFGIRNLLSEPIGFGVPDVSVPGFSKIGNPGNPTTQVTNVYQLINHLTLIRGRHSLKVGTDFRKTNYNDRSDRNVRGTYNFSGEMTALPGRAATTGVSVADLLLGLPLTATGANTSLAGNFNNFAYAFFVQDDWKVSQRLTLNLGLRYDLNLRYTDVQNRLSFFDSEFPGGRLLLAGTNQAYIPRQGVVQGPVSSRTILAADRNNWQPRVGLALRPFNDNKTVVRAAYGLFTDAVELQDLRTFVRNPPFGAVIETRTNTSGGAADPDVLRVSELFPAAGTPAARPNVFSPAYSYPDPYYQQWNFGIERELPASVKVELGYLGSKGTRMAQRFNYNQARLDADPSRPTPVNDRRLYPLWGNTLRITEAGANSTYHGGFVKFEKRFSSGLSFLSSYTYAKSLDGSAGLDEQPRDIFNKRLDKARSSHDIRQRVVLSGSYEMPFGKGKRWATGGAGAAVLGGWQWNYIATFRTGFPFSVISPGDPCNCAGRAQTAQPIGDPYLGLGASRERWFNTSAFAIPRLGTFGASGRNIIDGPGDRTIDLSLFRNLRVKERFQVQFRAEAFNSLNRTSFGQPGNQINSPVYGVITSAESARSIQLALKLVY